MNGEGEHESFCIRLLVTLIVTPVATLYTLVKLQDLVPSPQRTPPRLPENVTSIGVKENLHHRKEVSMFDVDSRLSYNDALVLNCDTPV